MTIKLNVHNIKCGGCAASIKDKIGKLSGISNLKVSPEDGWVQFDANNEDDATSVKDALTKMGYPEDDPNIIQTAKSYVSCMIGRMK